MTNQTAFCNTKEGIHIAAKERGIKPWTLGCNCFDCCKEFDKILNEAEYNQDRIMSLSDIAIEDAYIEGWNEAIEEAAKLVGGYDFEAGEEVRKLKK